MLRYVLLLYCPSTGTICARRRSPISWFWVFGLEGTLIRNATSTSTRAVVVVLLDGRPHVGHLDRDVRGLVGLDQDRRHHLAIAPKSAVEQSRIFCWLAVIAADRVHWWPPRSRSPRRRPLFGPVDGHALVMGAQREVAARGDPAPRPPGSARHRGTNRGPAARAGPGGSSVPEPRRPGASATSSVGPVDSRRRWGSAGRCQHLLPSVVSCVVESVTVNRVPSGATTSPLWGCRWPSGPEAGV